MSVKTVKLSDLTKGREIAAGGEGKIFEHPSDNKKVIKVYHKTRKSQFVKHLEKLNKLDSLFFICPQDIYINAKGGVLGFDMKYVNFNDYYLFNNLFNKGFCNSNGIDKTLKMGILNVISDRLSYAHKNGITIGDLNQYNIFIEYKTSNVLFVDVDSYQTQDNPHSGVLLDDIRDWNTTLINDQTDQYAYDVLAFWATTYCHPYKWIVVGNKDSLETRVRKNMSILSKIPDIRIPALYEPPVGELLKQFTDIFNHGRRYLVTFNGTYIPVSTVIKQVVSIVSNSLTIRELYNNALEVYSCGNTFSVKTGKEWVLVESTIPKITRESFSIECDELYPTTRLDTFAYRKGYRLYGKDPSYIKNLYNSVFYYKNGYLCVIEQDNDIQWNFDLSNQLAGNIDSTSTPIFAKSIIRRRVLLQNFGSKKYFNIPSLNRYTMISVPDGTKDGMFDREHIVTEVRIGTNTEYILFKVSNSQSMTFDYFPHFTVGANNMVFIPEEGTIDIYSNAQLVTKLECPMCTRSSKLFYTVSGILLLEDKKLYLLNTK